MAQQESIIKLKGKIGDLTFYKTRTGYQARQVTGVSADRIANDPKFQRTRENNAEFATGGAAAKRLRQAFRPLILLTYDTKMPSRLFSRMMRVLRADTVNARGERKVLAENLSPLRQFNFNIAAELSNTLFARQEVTIDRATGTVNLTLETLQPAAAVAAPQGATHFQLNYGASAVDFDSEEMTEIATGQSESFSLKEQLINSQTLSLNIGNADELPVFVLFGITFYQEVNTVLYPLNNGAYNAISIIQIDVP
ncbi:hypothetical protein [Olivibacter sp. XZL3]|uniref:hypothetical protein n=1 Tax=Olivibacter sp. XZL3 TaxID=1735116 RepID=UPI0010657C4E|nr:hypothetical protein [Olivibacter sp. XZL3]